MGICRIGLRAAHGPESQKHMASVSAVAGLDDLELSKKYMSCSAGTPKTQGVEGASARERLWDGCTPLGSLKVLLAEGKVPNGILEGVVQKRLLACRAQQCLHYGVHPGVRQNERRRLDL